ncbi:hypothetical protein GCM10009646_82110 [Streptomyces aureus]
MHPRGMTLMVHCELCGVAGTTERLSALDMKARAANRAQGPFQPGIARATGLALCPGGYLDRDAPTEGLAVIRGERTTLPPDDGPRATPVPEGGAGRGRRRDGRHPRPVALAGGRVWARSPRQRARRVPGWMNSPPSRLT